jgi:hypothetical protein
MDGSTSETEAGVMEAGVAGKDASAPFDAGQDAGSDASVTPDAAVEVPPPPPPALGNYSSLIHRYSFNGASLACMRDGPDFTVPAAQCALDSIGGKHGILHNVSFNAAAVEFTGAGWVAGSTSPPPAPQYVELPAGIISVLRNATLIVWFRWSGDMRGSYNTPRVFNFGSDDGANQLLSYWYLTPSHDDNNTPRMAFKAASSSVMTADAPARPSGSYCYGAVFNQDRGQVLLVRQGYFSAVNGLLGNSLAGLDDVKNWLGRSPVAMDTPFVGTIDEFRVYDDALDYTDVQSICDNPN